MEAYPPEMDPGTYLTKHHLLTYLEDAVIFLLGRRDEDSRVKPFELLSDYFKSIRKGTHIVFREYNFISATPYNRKSFIGTLWTTYSEVPECKEPMRVIELHSLLRLICADFPLVETEQVIKPLNAENKSITFTDFMHIFQITFYFDYFLGHMKTMYPSLLMGAYIPPLYPQFSSAAMVVVPLPPSLPTTTTSPTNSTTSTNDTLAFSKRVDGGILLEAALGLCKRIMERDPGESCPSLEALREVLKGVEQLSFYEFIMKLSQSDRINKEIGALP